MPVTTKELLSSFRENHSAKVFQNINALLFNINNKKPVKVFDLGDPNSNAKAERVLKIENLNFYFVPKQFRKKKLGEDSSDEGRLSALLKAISNGLKDMDEFNPYFFDKDSFFKAFDEYFSSEHCQSVLKPLIKENYKAFKTAVKNLLNSSESEVTQELVNLKKCVRYYSPSFESKLKDREFKVYQNENITPDDMMILNSKIVEAGGDLLNIFSFETCNHVWIIDGYDPDETDKLSEISSSDLTNLLRTSIYDVTSFHRDYLNKKPFDTIKRHFFVKDQGEIDQFYHKTKCANQTINIKCYKGMYMSPSEYNDLNEIQLGNAFDGFIKNYDSIRNDVIGCVFFNGEIGNVQVETYWYTNGDIQKLMNTPEMLNGTFYKLYNFEEITPQEFVAQTARDSDFIKKELIH